MPDGGLATHRLQVTTRTQVTATVARGESGRAQAVADWRQLGGPQAGGGVVRSAAPILSPAIFIGMCVSSLLAVAALFWPVAGQTEPTAEETAVLCWVNRFRHDPQAFGRLVIDGNKPENAGNVDWEMFSAEIAALAPAPPLFFEPRLIDASRAHARYMIQAQEYGHHETEGRPGFTGEWPDDRARAAGYMTPVNECAFARGGTALQIVAGYIVDAAPPGEGSGGMQEGRGHRRCMIDRKWREMGVGLFAWGDGLMSTVELYGQVQDAGRILGGVAIDDRDGNAFYGVGEGLGGVHIAVNNVCTMSSSSGAWRLDLPPGETAKKLVARLGSLHLEREILSGTENLQIDLLFGVQRVVADLEAELAKLPDSSEPRRRALRLKLLGLRAPSAPIELQLAGEVAEFKAAVLAGLGTWSRTESEQTFQTGKRRYAGTVIDDWMHQAQTADALARATTAVRSITNAAARTKRARAVAMEIHQALNGITNIDLWRALVGLHRDLLGM